MRTLDIQQALEEMNNSLSGVVLWAVAATSPVVFEWLPCQDLHVSCFAFCSALATC